MDATFFNSLCQGWPSAVWALAFVAVAFFFFRYRASTATQRFQAKEASAVRDQARNALAREDRLRQEERSATINAERRKLEREDKLREAEEKKTRYALLREEAKNDPVGNTACAEQCLRIIAEADSLIAKVCLYYTVCKESYDPDEGEPDDLYANLGDMQDSISTSYSNALDYLQEAQDMVAEGLYVVAKGQAEAGLIEARYASDRISVLDTRRWNSIQTTVR